MIRYKRGNLFESGAQTLVNTVNCVGVMGKGVAKEFKDRWPEMYRQYQTACRRGELRPGRPFLYEELEQKILCLPTKDNWKGPSKYEFIEAGLRSLRDYHKAWGITSLAMPAIGCGLGGLEWSKVKALIEQYLGDLSIPIDVYEPAATDVKVAGKSQKRTVTPVKVTLPLILVGEIIRRARESSSARAILGKLLVQKLAFFAQVAGAPLRLRFDKYQYGPYDYNLHHMIERLEGLYIRDESASWAQSNLVMLDEAGWSEAIAPFREQIERYSPYLDAAVGLLSGRALETVELLATVQYAWCTLVASGLSGNDNEVEEFVHEWSQRKLETFPHERIQQAIGILGQAGWLGPTGPGQPSPLTDPVSQEGLALLA